VGHIVSSLHNTTVSWERRRNGKRFYYQAQRVMGKVVKRYVGAGVEAERLAGRDAALRAERAAQRRAEVDLRRRVLEAGRMLVKLGRDCEDVATAALAAAGLYRHHRGEWRRYGGRNKER
jgi:hypothetical protein